MTRTRIHQNRPNRRYRRLLPAALIGATMAAGFPLGGPPPARADAPRKVKVAPPPVRKAVVPRTPARGADPGQVSGS